MSDITVYNAKQYKIRKRRNASISQKHLSERAKGKKSKQRPWLVICRSYWQVSRRFQKHWMSTGNDPTALWDVGARRLPDVAQEIFHTTVSVQDTGLMATAPQSPVPMATTSLNCALWTSSEKTWRRTRMAHLCLACRSSRAQQRVRWL